MTFALLMFMAGLINKESSHYKSQEETPYFDLLMSHQDESFERKNRRQPEPPEPKPQATALPSDVFNAAMPDPQLSSTVDLPSLDLAPNITAMAIAMPGIERMQAAAGTQAGDVLAMPLYRVEPRYPSKALRLGKQGYVLLSFDITETGRVSNIQVLDAKPKHLFEQEARRALKRWKYKPMLVDGKAVMQTGQKIRLDFKMDA